VEESYPVEIGGIDLSKEAFEEKKSEQGGKIARKEKEK